jgi:hypothetical protein
VERNLRIPWQQKNPRVFNDGFSGLSYSKSNEELCGDILTTVSKSKVFWAFEYMTQGNYILKNEYFFQQI